MPTELVTPKEVYCPKCDALLKLSEKERESGETITCPKCNYSGKNTTFLSKKNEYKFCKFCGEKITHDAVLCTKCGRQVEELKSKEDKQIIINNLNNNTNSVHAGNGRPISKWTAFILCFFFGWAGIHKFYEGKILTGLIYLCTGGLFGIGWAIDTLLILFKSDPYYV